MVSCRLPHPQPILVLIQVLPNLSSGVRNLCHCCNYLGLVDPFRCAGHELDQIVQNVARLHQMLQVIVQPLGVDPFWQLRYLPVIGSVDNPGNRLYLATVFGVTPSLFIPVQAGDDRVGVFWVSVMDQAGHRVAIIPQIHGTFVIGPTIFVGVFISVAQPDDGATLCCQGA